MLESGLCDVFTINCSHKQKCSEFVWWTRHPKGWQPLFVATRQMHTIMRCTTDQCTPNGYNPAGSTYATVPNSETSKHSILSIKSDHHHHQGAACERLGQWYSQRPDGAREAGSGRQPYRRRVSVRYLNDTTLQNLRRGEAFGGSWSATRDSYVVNDYSNRLRLSCTAWSVLIVNIVVQH